MAMTRSVLKAVMLVVMLAPEISLAQNGPPSGVPVGPPSTVPRGPPSPLPGKRGVPEFDPAAIGVVAALVAGGGLLAARRRRR